MGRAWTRPKMQAKERTCFGKKPLPTHTHTHRYTPRHTEKQRERDRETNNQSEKDVHTHTHTQPHAHMREIINHAQARSTTSTSPTFQANVERHGQLNLDSSRWVAEVTANNKQLRLRTCNNIVFSYCVGPPSRWSHLNLDLHANMHSCRCLSACGNRSTRRC